jgi:hypothetical protein
MQAVIMRTVYIGLCLALAVWPLTGRAAGPEAWLVLSGEEPERVLVCLPLPAGIPFHLEFINSIYLAPVRETFVYQAGEGLFVIQVESPSAAVFEYYGLTPEKPGTARLRRRLGEIRLRSMDYRNHRLTVGDSKLALKGIVADGHLLVIRVQPGASGGPCPG